jgi:hypothetical protein
VAGSGWDADADTGGGVGVLTSHPSMSPTWWLEADDVDDSAETVTLLGVTEFGGFLGDGGRTLTTWNGIKLADVVSLVRIERYTPSEGFVGYTAVRAMDIHGQEWTGQSPGVGLYAHMRRRH